MHTQKKEENVEEKEEVVTLGESSLDLLISSTNHAILEPSLNLPLSQYDCPAGRRVV